MFALSITNRGIRSRSRMWKTHVLHKHWRAADGLVRWMGWMDVRIQHKDTQCAPGLFLPTFHWRALQAHWSCERDEKSLCTMSLKVLRV